MEYCLYKKIYNCKIAISEIDIENIDNTKIKTYPSKKTHTNWTKLMTWGMKKFVPKNFEIDYLLKDEQIIDKYGLNLKIIHLPGHTTGSIGILYKEYLFAGDSLVNRKKIPEIANQNQNKNSLL